jgi:hypothetical protein
MAIGILMKELRARSDYQAFTVLRVDNEGKEVMIIISEDDRISSQLKAIIERGRRGEA